MDERDAEVMGASGSGLQALAGCGKISQPGSRFEVPGSRERPFSTEMRSSVLDPSTVNLEQEECFSILLGKDVGPEPRTPACAEASAGRPNPERLLK